MHVSLLFPSPLLSECVRVFAFLCLGTRVCRGQSGPPARQALRTLGATSILGSGGKHLPPSPVSWPGPADLPSSGHSSRLLSSRLLLPWESGTRNAQGVHDGQASILLISLYFPRTAVRESPSATQANILWLVKTCLDADAHMELARNRPRNHQIEYHCKSDPGNDKGRSTSQGRSAPLTQKEKEKTPETPELAYPAVPLVCIAHARPGVSSDRRRLDKAVCCVTVEVTMHPGL